MAKKRVFVAINLPENIKKDLEKALSKVPSPLSEQVRFLSPENWHLTISFLAYQDDHGINLISQAIEETSRSFSYPRIHFGKIIYGPPGKTPRMIWLTGSKETSEALGKIKFFLEKRLADLGVKFRQEHRLFSSHLTLARFEATSRKSLPPLEINFDKKFDAQSIDLMESHLKRSGAEYSLLSKFDFRSEEN